MIDDLFATEECAKAERAITRKALDFAIAYAATAHAKKSAIAAGVPEKSAGHMAYKWLRDPRVIRAIQDEGKRIHQKNSTIIIKNTRKVLKNMYAIADQEKNMLARFEACKHLLALAGFVAEQKTTTNNNVKADVSASVTIQDQQAVRDEFETQLTKFIGSNDEEPDTETAGDLPTE